MSVYRQCSEAAAKLMENGEIFTEIDVVRLAGTNHDWATETYTEALRDANQVVGTLYRNRKVCRFGPVELPNGERDYARIASKIVYAPSDKGIVVWETPNGDFPALMVHEDEIGRQGRRKQANRSDLVKWDDQAIATDPVDEDDAARRVKRLEADLRAANKALADQESQLQRMRDHAAVPKGKKGDPIRKLIDDAVAETLAEFDSRLSALEGIEAKRQKIYVS